MTDTVPILVGITGKRGFSDDPGVHIDLAETVRARLRLVFAELDMRYPGTSKLLLTGGAQGTDTIAAQEALKRDPQEWRVAVLLSFERSLFEKDFQESGPLQDFRALLAAAESDESRVMVRTLPPLHTPTGVWMNSMASSRLSTAPTKSQATQMNADSEYRLDCY